MNIGKQWLTVVIILGVSFLMFAVWDLLKILGGYSSDYNYVVTEISPQLFPDGLVELMESEQLIDVADI